MDKRIFGIETEFGISYSSPDSRPLAPEEVARYLFRKVVSWGRSSNVFLTNGSRLYLDVGSHPEYATAECDDLAQLIAHDRAGELILDDLVDEAQATAGGRGLQRHRLPVQEQHRLRRELLRQPRELPDPAPRRVLPAGRDPDPVPGHPPADRRRRQDPEDPARGHFRVLPARRPHLGGRLRRPPPGPGPSSTPGTSRTRTPSSTGGCMSSWATPTCPRPRPCSRSAPWTSSCG